MTDFGEFYGQAQSLLAPYVPSEAIVPVALIIPATMAILGLGTAVLGARLAKSLITSSFASAGVVAGVLTATHYGVPGIISVPGGALLFGIAGHFLHRLWIGLAAGAMLSIVVSSGFGFGADGLLAKLQGYEQAQLVAADSAVPPAQLGAQASDDRVVPDINEWMSDVRRHAVGFWNYASANDATLHNTIGLLGFASGLVGVIVGVVAVRFTLVVGTAILGTVMLGSGATALTHMFSPELFASAAQYPRAVAASCGLLLAASIVFQTLLTRPDKPAKKRKTAKS